MKTLLTTTALILSMTAAANAFAATSPALPVNNVNDPVNHPFQQTVLTSCNAQTFSCVATFTMQASMTLIQHVSCVWNVPVDTAVGSVTSAELWNASSGDNNWLPVSSWSSSNFGFLNTDTYLFALGGSTVDANVQLASPGANGINCTISGYHN